MPRSRVLWPVLLLLLAFATRSAEAGIDRWTPLGPDGGTITALAADPQGTGFQRSVNGGATWRRLNAGLRDEGGSGILLDDVAPSPFAPGVLLAGGEPEPA